MINKDKLYEVKELWDLPYAFFDKYWYKSRTARYNLVNSRLNPEHTRIWGKEMISVKGSNIIKFIKESGFKELTPDEIKKFRKAREEFIRNEKNKNPKK